MLALLNFCTFAVLLNNNGTQNNTFNGNNTNVNGSFHLGSDYLPALYGNEWHDDAQPISYDTRLETYGPQVINKEVRVSRNIEVGGGEGPGMRIDVAEIIIDFNQDLYVDDLITREPIDIFTEQVPLLYRGTQPKSLAFSKELVHLVCGDQEFHPLSFDNPQVNGPDLSGIYVSGSVTSPFSNFLMAMSGAPIKEPAITNRFSCLLVLKFGQLENNVNFTQCHLSFNNPNSPFDFVVNHPNVRKRFVNIPHYIVALNGTPISNDVQLVEATEPKCDATDFQHFYDLSLHVIEQFETTTLNKNDFYRIPSIFQGMKANTAYTACIDFVNTLYTTTLTTLNILTSANCQFSQNTPEFDTDPCCNQELAQYQCCAPRIRTIPFQTIDQFSEVEVNKCQKPDNVKSLVLGVIELFRQQTLVKSQTDPNTAYLAYTDFFQTCSDKVYNQDCITNAQCLSGFCSDQNRKCFVPWGNDTTLLLQCYLDTMQPELFYQIKSDLNLPFSNNASASDLASIKQTIEDSLSEFDCVGNTAWQSGGQKRCSWNQDQNGYYQETCVPANEDLCLANKVCNSQPWQTTSQQECESAHDRNPEFCARCDSGYCYNVGYPSKCNAWIQTESLCTRVGGNFYSYSYNWGNYTECTFNHENSRDQCLAGICQGDYCNAFAYTNDTVAEDCYLRSQQRDNNNQTAPWFYWYGQGENNTEYCNVYYPVDQQAKNQQDIILEMAIADGFSINVGKNYQQGYLSDESTCEAGMCDNYQIQTTNATACAASGYCSRGCSKCTSNNWDSSTQSACLVVTNSTTCAGYSGTFANDTCVIGGSTQTDCESKNGILKTCNSYSEDQCGGDMSTSFMNCQWNQWSNCNSNQECDASGECDDYEFQNNCQWTNSCTPNTKGVCLFPPTYNNGYRQCGQDMQWSRIGCINQSLNKFQCSEQQGMWKQRASTSEQCAAHGQSCFEKKTGQYTYKNSTECAECGGKQGNTYSWYGGFWKSGKMIPGSWKEVSYASDNQFIKVVSRERLQTQLQNSVAAIVGLKVLNTVKQSVLVPLLAIKQIACLCESTSDCFSNVTVVPQRSCRADPGVPSECGITFPGNTNSSIKVDIGLLPAGQYSSSGPAMGKYRFKLRKRITSSNYAVVQTNGNTVGQLIGDGKSFIFNMQVDSFFGCLDVNQQIPQDPFFPIYDAVFVLPNGDLSAPLHITMSVNGLQICGTFTQQGTYFPILRIANDELLTAVTTSLVGIQTTSSQSTSVTTFINVQATSRNTLTSSKIVVPSQLPSDSNRVMYGMVYLIMINLT